MSLSTITCPSFPMGELGAFSSFQVNHVFHGELYEMKLNFRFYHLFSLELLDAQGITLK